MNWKEMLGLNNLVDTKTLLGKINEHIAQQAQIIALLEDIKKILQDKK